jgi:MATE family multidrug resistance protein
LSLALNLVLVPLFILGFNWGVAGAAIASNVARAVATSFGLMQLVRLTGIQPEHLRLRGGHLKVLRIGIPSGTGTVMFAIVYWSLLKTSVSPLGPEVNAALGIGFSALEGVTWPLFHGLALGVASMVGRRLGAGRPDLAAQALRIAAPLSLTLGLTAALAFAGGGAWLTSWFTDDPGVHHAATEYAIILSVSQPFVALEALSEGVLAGAGATRTVFWFSVPWNIARIPLAYLLAFDCGWGASGVWWAINVSTFVKALLKSWAAWRGRWTSLRL